MHIEGFKDKIEQNFYQKISAALKNLKKAGIKVGYNNPKYEVQPLEEMIQEIGIDHIRTLKIMGMDMEREKNKYIHEYNTEKKEDQLIYTIKPVVKTEIKIETTGHKMKEGAKLAAEELAKNEEGMVKRILKNPLEMFGIKPKPKNSVQEVTDWKKNVFKKMEGSSYILVDDFELSIPFGIVLTDTKTNEQYGEITKDSIYNHTVRVEKFCDVKDAPSVRRAKEYIISDIDYTMRGNPHALVKNFLK